MKTGKFVRFCLIALYGVSYSAFLAPDACGQDRERIRQRPTLGVGGVYSERGYRLTQIHRGSQGEAVGLQPGDYILVADGRPIGSYDYRLSRVFETASSPSIEIAVRYRVGGQTFYYYPLINVEGGTVVESAEAVRGSAQGAAPKERPRRRQK